MGFVAARFASARLSRDLAAARTSVVEPERERYSPLCISGASSMSSGFGCLIKHPVRPRSPAWIPPSQPREKSTGTRPVHSGKQRSPRHPATDARVPTRVSR